MVWQDRHVFNKEKYGFDESFSCAYMIMFVTGGVFKSAALLYSYDYYATLTRIVSFDAGSISTAEGSAIVKLGNTSVICGVKAVRNKSFSSDI